MVRTQIYLTRAQHRGLKREAARQRVSMTELLRRILDSRLKGHRGVADFRKEDVLLFIGLAASGRPDTSERHDAALDEAFRGGALR